MSSFFISSHEKIAIQYPVHVLGHIPALLTRTVGPVRLRHSDDRWSVGLADNLDTVRGGTWERETSVHINTKQSCGVAFSRQEEEDLPENGVCSRIWKASPEGGGAT